MPNNNQNKYHVLIVEDEEYIARALRDNLTPRGCDTVTAPDGAKAMEYLTTHVPDIIILDLVMPNRDGFFVLSKLKDNPVFASIPVFVLSNLGEPEDIRHAMELGAKDYFVKSHNTIAEVVARVMQLLEKETASTQMPAAVNPASDSGALQPEATNEIDPITPQHKGEVSKNGIKKSSGEKINRKE